MKKIFIIFGTRPEAIKCAPIINELKKYSSDFKTVICVTGQHRQMLDQVLSLFEIVPDYDINIMSANQDLFDVTVKILTGLREILKKEQPDLVLVQGDTTTAFTASLAAFYLKIAVGHIEAGLRTYDKYYPFPEEINRHGVSVLADHHFAPTDWAKSNLLKEGIAIDRIYVTGNTVIDALYMILKRPISSAAKLILDKIGIDNGNRRKMILVTAHRRESFGEAFENICLSLKELAEKRSDIVIVYPVHLNPNVQQPVKKILSSRSNIHLIEPLEYEPFVFLMNNSYLILTDSGGVQEEAPSLGKPVLVMRSTTERPEGIEARTVKLIGTNKSNIVNETQKLLDNAEYYEEMSRAINPYGDGRAAERILEILHTSIFR